MKVKFLRCSHCGKIIAMVKETSVATVCCGETMNELVAGAIEAAAEKHIPVFEVKGNEVHVVVGSVEHPMTEEHFIEWICLETKFGNQRKQLLPNAEPKAKFAMCEGDEVVSVYAYCNLHGLWKK